MAFDRVARESSNLLVPDGKLIMKPLSGRTYTAGTARDFLREARDYATELPEAEPVSALLLYVNHGDHATDQFVEQFFPFCLSAALSPLDIAGVTSKNELNRRLNAFVRTIALSARTLRKSADAVKAALSGSNLTPLLLPLRNFASQYLRSKLQVLFLDLAKSSDPGVTVATAQEDLIRQHPWVKSQTDAKRCLSDGILYFKSPGSDRHGYFRHPPDPAHNPECLLKARSRLGGPFRHTFHYDCTPVHGHLAPAYPNCHGGLVAPKPTHVNIAPSDYII